MLGRQLRAMESDRLAWIPAPPPREMALDPALSSVKWDWRQQRVVRGGGEGTPAVCCTGSSLLMSEPDFKNNSPVVPQPHSERGQESVI